MQASTFNQIFETKFVPQLKKQVSEAETVVSSQAMSGQVWDENSKLNNDNTVRPYPSNMF